MRLWQNAPGKPPVNSQELGKWGEGVAANWLRKNQYRVLRQNYRATGGGEVDIVARHKPTKTLCFIEVKTRSSEKYGRPSLAVNKEKERLVIRGALSWLRLLNMPDIAFRFDIIEIIASDPPEISMIEDAYHLPPEIFY